jgi:two-component system chemotaxis sensor kinase CheA
MTVDMSQFYEIFFDESEELLAEAEHLLLGIDVEDPDVEDLNAIFRAAHSIKGGAATFGFSDMTEITHVLENLLDRIRKNEMALTAEHVDAFLAAKDVLKMEVYGHRLDVEVDLEQVAEVKAKLKAFADAGGVEIKAAPVAQTKAPTPVAEAAPVVNDTVVVEAAPVAGGPTVFNIALPEVTDKDLENLKEELALLGEAEAIKQDDGHAVIKLTTDDSTELDIISICSFIVDADALVITTVNVAAAAPVAEPKSAEPDDGKVKVVGEVGYGLFEEEGKEKVEEGYGFFAPFKPHENVEQPQLVDDNAKLTLKNSGQSEKVEAAKEAAPAAKEKHNQGRRATDKAPAAAETTSIRVGIEKVDQLINLVGELVITQAMIDQRISSLDPVHNEGLINSVTQLTRNTKDLQESVMSIRMMPMDFVFSRFPRMVRDLAGKLDKKVNFVTEGSTTELDKGLIEKIVDPLTHLVRNSVDHGVETPEKRRAANKDEAGTLTLSASHKGGSIVIEVTDDGAGLDRDKILAKAASNGLDVSESMTDTEVFGMIFAPGFSTAAVVTDVSGRGVGMDVVKRNIDAMGGTVEIRSALGFGTTISIALPLTLAILDGMSVALGENLYVVPLNLIVETLQPVAEDIKTVTGEGHMVHVRGEYLPIISLHKMFNQPTEITDPTKGVLVLIEAEGKKSALFVDRLVGQQQVVVKSLETNYKRIPGVSGATIMGDGSVALIIDVPAIIQMGQTTNYVTGGVTYAQQNQESISNPLNA